MTGNEHAGRTESIAVPTIESRSIDFIPLNERHGKVWHQGPFWFMGNANLTTAFAGVIGAALGLNLIACLIAIILGSAFGTFFMAFHAVQGPRLGLPQMIQSRVQFGARGAIVPFAAVLFIYLGFSVFNTLIAADSLGQITAPHPSLYAGVILGFCALIAVVGYNMIHRVQRWLSSVLLVNLLILTIAILYEVPLSGILEVGSFSWLLFLAQFGASAGYQMAFAPYVSDYTRYLPRDTSTGAVVGWTYVGVMSSAVWLEALGALMAVAFPREDAVRALYSHGNAFFGGLGTVSMALAVLSFIGVTSLAIYGGMLTALSIKDAVKPSVISVRFRSITTVSVACVAYLIILWLPEDYLASFGNFLTLLLYFLVPWTAVNLVDFYLVRRERYAISEILAPNAGVYGRWGREGLISYAVGFIAMIPFFSTSMYTGPAAHALKDADVSFLIGLPVAALCYYLLMRKFDLAPEMTLVEAEERQNAADSHSRLAEDTTRA